MWHSSAHILGAAIEQVFEEPKLTIGPPISEGFYYDFFSDSGQVVTGEEYGQLEDLMQAMVKADEKFERLVISKEQALSMFDGNQFKQELINEKVSEGDLTSVYRIGDFVDLCTGPHVPSTAYAAGIKVMKHSQAYWKADAERESLQRIYGISFPKKKLLQEYVKQQEEAKKRDHRLIGAAQELYFFSDMAPGSPFFLPKGTILYNKLVDFMKAQYKKRGYEEVITPNLCSIDLWKTSGHY